MPEIGRTVGLMAAEAEAATAGSLWAHLPLLVRSGSKESVEYILQALWRTRRTGLDATDRRVIRSMLDLPSDSDLDPLLVCLRMLIRRCVYENISKDEIQKLFPQEVVPELQRLLVLLLQKFQHEWREDVKKDQVSLPRLKAMTWNMANQDADSTDQVVVINLKIKDEVEERRNNWCVDMFLEDDEEERLRLIYKLNIAIPSEEIARHVAMSPDQRHARFDEELLVYRSKNTHASSLVLADTVCEHRL